MSFSWENLFLLLSRVQLRLMFVYRNRNKQKTFFSRISINSIFSPFHHQRFLLELSFLFKENDARFDFFFSVSLMITKKSIK